MLRRATMALLAAASLAASAVPAARATGAIDRAVSALRQQPVYVDPAARPTFGAPDVEQLRARIADADAGPLYIAVLGADARNEAGGSASEVLKLLYNRLQREGTYAVVVAGQFRAASTLLRPGEAGDVATQAFDAHHDEGVAATLLDFVDRVGAARRGERPGGDGDSGGGGIGVGLIALLAAGAGGVGYLAWRNRRRRNADFAQVREAAQEDLLALADDVRALDVEVELPRTPAAAKDDYGQALDQYERAAGLLDRARTPDDLQPVAAALEEGRFAMASAKARLEGRPPPERRPPCFFNPRHGPSAREVEWAPPGGVPRLVPACEADAQRVEQGFDPDARQVRVDGRVVPYWNAPAAYGPWAGGYFSGFGAFLPALLFGSLVSDALAQPGPIDVDSDAGRDDFGDDLGGGGDFGGVGDFGGGDFGGGDFGGGGGGDFS